MTTNDMYQAAVANMTATKERYGVSRHTLANGDVIFCSIKAVAGCSIVSKHHRTTFGLKLAAAQYAKPVSRDQVVKLLRVEP